jgi:hypothetical protein
VKYVCGVAHFSQSASTLNSGDIGVTLSFWQREIKGKQENVIHADLSGLSRR